MKPPVCILCRTPVRGDAEGVAFVFRGKPLFFACHKHAPMVQDMMTNAGLAARSSLEQIVRRRFPLLAGVFEELQSARRLRENT